MFIINVLCGACVCIACMYVCVCVSISSQFYVSGALIVSAVGVCYITVLHFSSSE